MERIVKLLDDRVLLARIGDKLVAAKASSVVEANLRLDVHVLDAGVSREEVELTVRVGKILLKVLCQADLRLELHGIGIILLRLGHVSTGSRADVDNLVLALERFEVRLHATELLLDDNEALVDKVGSVHCHLVFVVHRILVVDCD